MKRRGAVASLLLIAIIFTMTALPAFAKEDQYLEISMRSSLLSQFWGGDEVVVRAHVLLPDSYYKEPERRFPVLYVVHALGGDSQLSLADELRWQRPMRKNGIELIFVFLDANFKGIHTLFADSENNGPWASALTQEFIPETDAHFRTIADAGHRFLAGHSSGAWAALWLQVKYPQLFGGVWSVAPDPVDFHDYAGPNITTPNANMYRGADGSEYRMWRGRGGDAESMRQFARDYVGHWQFELDEAAYSPKGKDGRPVPLFDRRTGNIDAAVAAHWEASYDITHVVADEWPQHGNDLDGKLHIYVGTEDTFHLTGSVRLLQNTLQKLGAREEIVYVPDADHWTVFDYNGGLYDRMVREIKSTIPQ